MRWKLLRRRLSISAPHMSVRSHLPWPLRWAAVALMLGFSGALAMWAFDLGQRIAGLQPAMRYDGHSEAVIEARAEARALQIELESLRQEVERLRGIANTADSLLKAEQAAQQKLAEQVRALESDNQALRDDLGFFEHVLPVSPKDAVAVRGVQADRVSPTQLRYQVLVMNNQRRAPDFEGKLEVVLRGTMEGRPWTLPMPGGARELKFRQYRRVEGMIDVPAQAVIQAVQVTVTDARGRSATQTLRI